MLYFTFDIFSNSLKHSSGGKLSFIYEIEVQTLKMAMFNHGLINVPSNSLIKNAR